MAIDIIWQFCDCFDDHGCKQNWPIRSFCCARVKSLNLPLTSDRLPSSAVLISFSTSDIVDTHLRKHSHSKVQIIKRGSFCFLQSEHCGRGCPAFMVINSVILHNHSWYAKHTIAPSYFSAGLGIDTRFSQCAWILPQDVNSIRCINTFRSV